MISRLFFGCIVFFILSSLSCAWGQANYHKSPVVANGTTRDTSLDHLPRETFIPFTRQGNLMLVEGSINGKKITMVFDTGAAGCLFSLEMLKSLCIKIPANLPTATVGGVGNKRQAQAWIMPANIKLGSIERHQFPVYVNSNALNYPLLGVSFFQGFEYTINTDASIIQFKRVSKDKSTAATAAFMQELPAHLTSKTSITVDSSCHYIYTVPFAELNGAIIVMVNIGGRDCPMILDTGTSVCLFSNEHLRELGIAPHFTGKMLNAKGAVGFVKAPLCVFDEAQFGPIKDRLICLVSDQALLPRPLLGQNFFGKWQLTIDHTNCVIKFTRK